MRYGRALGTGLLLFALTGGCREHSGVCGGGACEQTLGTSGTGGSAAGAAGESQGAEAGQGGAAAECASDLECQDSGVCNGTEQCRSGSCVPGPKLVCEHGMLCREDAAAPCFYETPSPWTVFLAPDRLFGLPTAELGHRPLALLGEAEGLTDSLWAGFAWPTFSPDGRHLLISFSPSQSGEKLFELELGDGLPAFRAVPELPSPGFFSRPDFTLDSSHALISDDFSGAYLLELSGTNIWRISERWGSALGEHRFCGSSKRWVSSGASSHVGQLVAADVVETPLGPGPSLASPDQRYVLWEAGDAAPALIDCLDLDERTGLGRGSSSFAFSPTTEHLALVDADGIFRLLSLDDPSAPVEVWSGADVWGSPGFTADGKFAVLEQGESYVSLALAGAEPASATMLDLSGYVAIEQIAPQGVLAWVDSEDFTTKQLKWAGHDGAVARLLTTEASTSELLDSDLERGTALLTRLVDDHQELLLLRFDAVDYSEQLLYSYQGNIDIKLATDRSGLSLTLREQGQLTTGWLRFPSSDSEPMLEPLGSSIYDAVFQPWP